MNGTGTHHRAGRRARTWLALGALCVLGLVTAAAALGEDTLGFTTLQQRIVGDGGPGFQQLELDTTPGGGYVTRQKGIGAAQAGRESRRTSLAYFGQLSDFQLADEESPARVEFLDPDGDPFTSAHRPWEAMEPHVDDAMIRQVNSFAAAAPVAAGDGSRPAMDYSIDTGDSADSQQLNETRWVRTLIEGGQLDPNSGVDPAGYTHPFCPAGVPGAAEAEGYTGVQDYDDYVEADFSPLNYFYDPDDPLGPNAAWPQYPGLLDRAQAPFATPGVRARHYVAFGNHDALLQGSLGANALYEDVATGCIKALTDQFPDGRTCSATSPSRT